MLCRELLLLALLAAVAHAFIGSGDDAYMKKYALRKVWESCFGRDVVRQIRVEKRAAIAKCRQPPASLPGQQMSPAELALALAGQHEKPDVKDHFPAKKRPAQALLDPAKLQALLSYKQQQAAGGYLQPAPQPAPTSPQYNPFISSHFPSPQYSYSNQQNYPQLANYPQSYTNVQSYPSYPGVQQYGAQQYGAQQYGGAQQLFHPLAQQAQYQQAPFYPVGYYGNARLRSARDLNMQSALDLEALHRAIGAKSENVSCQLQELGYLDENLDPAYDKIATRVQQLPVEEELKRDMLDGLEFCKRFSKVTASRTSHQLDALQAAVFASELYRAEQKLGVIGHLLPHSVTHFDTLTYRTTEQCMPDMRQETSKFSQDQDKQMFFFSCYKHKKLEACLMKDVRERFMTDDPLTQDDLNGDDLRSLPRGRRAKMPDLKESPSEDRFDVLFQQGDPLPFV